MTFLWRFWDLRNPVTNDRRRGPNRHRPGFDAMEDRRLPSVTIQLDYSRDVGGFFAEDSRRDALQRAADTLSALLGDSLSAVVPSGSDHWSASFLDPGDGTVHSVADLVVPADTLRIFAGGRPLGADAELGLGGPGGYESSGSDSWNTLVATRGQTGAGPSSTDFGPWGGSVAFASDYGGWSFAAEASGIGTGQVDFTSVALHELGHVLGIGTATSWSRLSGPSGFVGEKATAAFGGAVPLDPALAHWADGTLSDGLPSAMDPTPEPGRRVPFGRLDVAALADIGWQVPDVPAPTTFAFVTPTFAAAETSGIAILAVSRYGDPSIAASVAFATSDGTASPLTDYTPVAGILEFLPGETMRTISVPLRPDELAEGTETFAVDLSRPSGRDPGLGLATATVEILDAPGRLRFSGSAARVGEGAGSAVLTVERIGGLGGALPYAIDVTGGTATPVADFTSPETVAAFVDGQRTATLTFSVVEDGVHEGDEGFRVTLRGLEETQIGNPATVAVTIADDDPLIGFATPTFVVDEDAGSVVLTVHRGGSSASAVVVNYTTIDDTAQSGVDYEAATGSLSFARGQSEATIRIPIHPGPGVTGDLQFLVSLRPPIGMEVPLPATVTIRDLTSLITVTGPGAVSEGAGVAIFTVARSGAIDRPVVLSYTTADGTARAGRNYDSIAGFLTLAPGQAVGTIAVPLIPDGLHPPSLSLGLAVSIATGDAEMGGDGTASATLLDTDPKLGSFRFLTSSITVDESTGVATVVVERLDGTDGAETVDYTTIDETARAGRNYFTTLGTLAFAPGESFKAIQIPILDDHEATGDLKFSLLLANPIGGAILGTPSRSSLTIRDRGGPPITPPASPLPFAQSVRIARVGRERFSLRIPVSGTPDPSRPPRVTSFRLETAGRDRKFGTKDDRRIWLRSANFDSTSNMAILVVPGRHKISRAKPVRLTVAGLFGLSGNLGPSTFAILSHPGDFVMMPLA